MSNNIRFNSVYFLLELAINIIRLVLSRNMSMSMHSAQKKVHVNATKRDHCVRFCQFILCLPLRTQATSLTSLSLFLRLLQSLFGKDYFYLFILLFNLFLLLFMNPTILFGTIHRSHFIISTNFYLYLQYFQQKIFS